MLNERKTGIWGEVLAARYLRDNGYVIANVNLRVGRTETDIVAFDGDTLVSVEVKTRTPGGMLPASEAVDAEKRRLLTDAGAAIKKMYGCESIRYDVIEVYFTNRDNHTIRHLKDVF